MHGSKLCVVAVSALCSLPVVTSPVPVPSLVVSIPYSLCYGQGRAVFVSHKLKRHLQDQHIHLLLVFQGQDQEPFLIIKAQTTSLVAM